MRYPEVGLHYVDPDGRTRLVATVEETEFQQFYHFKPRFDAKEQEMPLPYDGAVHLR